LYHAPLTSDFGLANSNRAAVQFLTAGFMGLEKVEADGKNQKLHPALLSLFQMNHLRSWLIFFSDKQLKSLTTTDILAYNIKNSG